MKKLILSLVIAGVGMTGQAHAEDGAPGASLLERKSVGVLPVLAPGLSRTATFQGVASMADRVSSKSTVSPRQLTQLEAAQGFGFAGASTEIDIVLLQLGAMTSALALELDNVESFKGSLELLGTAREVLAPLAPEVAQAFDRYLEAARQGKIDSQALGDLFAAAEAGIAKGPARAHGYLTAGLWFGLSMISATLGSSTPEFAAMAGPLAVLFEEDADLSGSDVKVAVSLRAVAKLISAEKIDTAKVTATLAQVFKLNADKP